MLTEGEDVMKISAVRPLSVEAVEFTPASATEQHIHSGRRTMSSGTGGSSPTEVVEPPPPLINSGGGGVRFTAVAEVHRPPSTDNEERLLAQASGQHAVENTDPGEAPVLLSAPRGDTFVSKPKMHSAHKKVLDGIPMERDWIGGAFVSDRMGTRR